MTKSDESGALGWDAIDAALHTVYGEQKPLHAGPALPMMLGGHEPLDGISCYRSDATQPHWHFVTYGMSELYEKESEDKERSGWGIEFTFRLTRSADEKEPPKWPLNLLQNIARYVVTSGNILGINHHVDLNGPIALEKATEIRAILVAQDPQLPEIRTANGKVNFIQLVGITLDELSAVRRWDAEKFLSLMRSQGNPLLVTDLRRRSNLLNEYIASEVEAGVIRDGSSTSSVYLQGCSWSRAKDEFELVIGAKDVLELKHLLGGRTGHCRGFVVLSGKSYLDIEPGEEFRITEEANGTTVTLPPKAAVQIASQLQQKQGKYVSDAFPQFTLNVVPSKIKDQDGNVVQVVGE